MQTGAALLPQLLPLARKPLRQRRLQQAQLGQALLLLLLLSRQFAQRQQRQVLPVGQLQLGVDGGQLVKTGRDLERIVKRRLVIEHQLAKNLVDAVELLEARRTVEQGECIGADLKKPLQPRQIGCFGGEDLQAFSAFLQPPQGTRAAAVLLFEPAIEAVARALRKEPAPVHVTHRRAAAFKPHQCADEHGIGGVVALFADQRVGWLADIWAMCFVCAICAISGPVGVFCVALAGTCCAAMCVAMCVAGGAF